jgi:hypothetical protein
VTRHLATMWPVVFLKNGKSLPKCIDEIIYQYFEDQTITIMDIGEKRNGIFCTNLKTFPKFTKI